MNYFLVFQNKSYKEERKGGFIWAPQYNKTGRTCHHWLEMKNVKKNDIIFNCCSGYMVSVLVAEEDCIEHNRPSEMEQYKELWEKAGWLVHCKYI